MIDALDMNSNVPLYQQLFLALQKSINAGEFPPGAKIPTEVELSERYNVSRITVRNAINELVKEKLLVKHQGKGTFVADNPRVKIPGQSHNFSSICRSEGLEPGAQLLGIEILPPTAEEMEFFRMEAPKNVFHIRRVRTADGQPVAVERISIPTSCAFILQADLERSFFEILRENGMPPGHSRWEIKICKANEEEQRLLGVPQHTNLLLVDERLHDEDGQPLYFCRTTIRSDTYRLVVF